MVQFIDRFRPEQSNIWPLRHKNTKKRQKKDKKCSHRESKKIKETDRIQKSGARSQNKKFNAKDAKDASGNKRNIGHKKARKMRAENIKVLYP